MTVTASGMFSRWPVRAWVNQPGVVVSAGEKNQLVFQVDQDAAPGIYWIRLFDDEGASSLRPFVVGTLPEQLEAEPNNEPASGPVFESPVVVNGRLEKAGDVDSFSVRVQKGQTLIASLEANRRLGSPVDTSLQIVSAAGFVLADNDDYHDLDPQLVFSAPSDGTYLVRVFGFPATPTSTIGFAGGEEFIYRLTLTTNGFVEYAYPLSVSSTKNSDLAVELFGWNLPSDARQFAVGREDGIDEITAFHRGAAGTALIRLEPHAAIVETENSSGEKPPQNVSLPVTITGRIDRKYDVDRYRFRAKKQEQLSFRAESRSLGFPLDPFMRLSDATGKTLIEVDDSGGGRDCELTYAVPEDGEFELAIRDLHGHGGNRFVYRLRMATTQPDYSLKLAADTFIVAPGKPLEIPVAVERIHGFSEEIEVVAEGLPNGASANVVKSLPSGDSAKSVKLVVSSERGPTAGRFQIVGRSPTGKHAPRFARAPIPSFAATTTDLWCTVTSGK